LEDSDRTELLNDISLHPSLHSLDLKMDRPGIDLEKRREVTKAVGDMLSVNERVEAMSFDDYAFYKEDCDAFVAPRLEYNLYRERFPFKNRSDVRPCCSLGKNPVNVFQDGCF
jgi:hypothetical protein